MTSPAFNFAKADPAASPLGAAQPSNIQAEQALLGALLYDNGAYERLTDKLQARHFHEPFHERLFAVLEDHMKRGQLADPILLADRFKADPAFEELGGLRYLADLVDRAPPAVNAPDYARVIYDLALRRDLIRIGGEIMSGAGGDTEHTARDLIETAEQQLYTLAESGASSSGFVAFDRALYGAVQMAAEAYSREGGLSGVSTGLIDLDRQLGGLHPSDLLILAGRPSMGKAQPLDARVLKKDGTWCPMGGLKLGDELASVDGAPSRVSGVYPQGVRDVMKVTFSDGRAAECCPEHLWSVSSEAWDGPRVLATRDVAALIEEGVPAWIDTPSGHFGGEGRLSVDPWILGRLIRVADEGSADPQGSVEAELRRWAERSAPRGGGRRRVAGGPSVYGDGDPGNDAADAAAEARRLLSDLKVIDPDRELSLPPAAFAADRQSRVALLRGLLGDEVGALFRARSLRLAEDFAALARSVGGLAWLRPEEAAAEEGCDPAPARSEVAFAGLPVGAPPAADGAKTRLAFASIEKARRAPVQCIAVTHPRRLYVTDDYVVTHNTALATNIAFHVARNYAYDIQPDGTKKTANGGVVAFFSLEMSAEQLAMRLLADVSGVSSDRLRKGDIDQSEFARVRDAALEIQESPLFIDATGGLSIAKLAARARRLKRTHGLDLIVVDYLQLVTGSDLRSNDNRVQEVSQITQGLKALAKELSVPVLALSQLSRQVESREDKRPQLSDLRESGSIEQDADAVMFVYRESYYLGRGEPRVGTPEHLSWQEEMDKVQGLAEVIIGKQRHGPIGTVRLHFNEDLTKFGNLAREGRFEPR